jgi:uncharacterized protein (TIGR02246 family)
MADDVLAATSSLVAALARGDAGAAASLYAEDGRLLASGEVLTGRSEIEAYWNAGLAVGLAGLQLQAIEIRIAPGIAVEIGSYSLKLGSTHDSAERGKYLSLHRRLPDGTWRREVDVFTPATGERQREEAYRHRS